MKPAVDVALVFPPGWYSTSVPTDLSYVTGALRDRGLRVMAFDLNAGFIAARLGHTRGFAAVRRWETYGDLEGMRQAALQLETECRAIGTAHQADYHLRWLRFPDIDPFHLPSLYAVGLDERRNPALPYLAQMADAVLAGNPAVIAIAAIHPEQLLHAVVFGRLLRRRGGPHTLVLYGELEDVLGPSDFAEDLIGEPRHGLFEDFDAAILGETAPALAALAADPGDRQKVIPNLLRRDDRALPPTAVSAASSWAQPQFDWVRAEHYPTPEPVVDLLLSRGCAWARCTFCAIHAHQGEYRTQPVAPAAESMRRAHRALGASFFRMRDELLTPSQLAALGEATRSLDFRPCWSARARIQEALDDTCLRAAAGGGLEELWVGLESAVPAVRERMQKGAREADAVALLNSAANAGVRLRTLCMLGFPGETEAEARQTIAFLTHHAARLAGASLTPFRLMRRSPMGRTPAAFGIDVAPFVHPREERLTPELPVRSAPGMTAEHTAAVHAEAITALTPLFLPKNPGPDIAHHWLAASTQRHLVRN